MRTTLILAALLAAAPLAASAEDMSYTWGELGYTRLDLDVGQHNEHIDGGYLRGSIQLAEPVYLLLGFSQLSKTYHPYPSIDDKLTLNQPSIGVGYRYPVAERIDLTGELSYTYVEAKEELSGYDDYLGYEYLDGTYKDHSYIGHLDIGVRGKPTNHTEGWVKLGYIDGDDMDSGEFIGTLGGQINFNRYVGLVGEVQYYDDTTQAMLGFRVSY